MIEESLVSIVLPTYNGARYLKEAVDSCLNQTYDNLELIVVVDASTDNTDAILAQYHDPRLVVIHHAQNQKLPRALNTGFARASGAYLTWTSDDNLYTPQTLATLVAYLESHPASAFVYAPYWEIDESGAVIRLGQIWPQTLMLKFNPIGPCFLYRRKVYESIGEYDTGTFLFEDYDYWLRVSQEFSMHMLDEPLYYYRVHQGALTNQTGVMHRRWRLATVLKRQRFGLSWNQYRVEMARIDIDEAFACYRDGEFNRVPGLALKGVLRNPAWLLNLGVTSITTRSILNTIKGRVSI